ncbi:hypothetical protein [Gelidibacter japonicus]|uniref:hypothetical protein n=1 Tax=Gelidibacter japonicus TaxID=1962232 RepID=UPI003A901F19
MELTAIAQDYTLLHIIARDCTPKHTKAHHCTRLHTIAHDCTPLHTFGHFSRVLFGCWFGLVQLRVLKKGLFAKEGGRRVEA